MESRFFIPFPQLNGERLRLRQLSDSDSSDISLLRSDEIVNRYLSRQKQTGIDEARVWIEGINQSISENKLLYWAICLKDSPRLIGTICLWNFLEREERAEVGYELMPVYHKQGIMSDALNLVIAYRTQTMPFKTLEAFTWSENVASIRMLQNFGFKHDTERIDPRDLKNIILIRRKAGE